MSEGITSIRIVCDKVAAHKDGRVQHIDVWRYYGDATGFSGNWWPVGKRKSGEKKLRWLDNPMPEDLAKLFPNGGEGSTRGWYEMWCRGDLCKHQRVQGRHESFTFALDYFAETGREVVTLAELGAILDRRAGLKRVAAKVLPNVLHGESAD